MAYFDIAKPTYIENWPRELLQLSIAQVDIPLTIEEARRLGANIVELGHTFCITPEQRPGYERLLEWSSRSIYARMMHEPEPPGKPEFTMPKWIMEDISDIRQRVSDAVDEMPDGAFIRLGSRSPKDSLMGYEHGLRVCSGTDPLRFLLGCSERVYDDLQLALKENYQPHIFVRQWQKIPKWSEFRCFMRDRKLVGISQYHYMDGEVFQEIVDDHAAIGWAISQFFRTFRDASHLDSVVFDVVMSMRGAQSGTRVWQVKLLEINPFFELTDPCLFSWSDTFGGEFRYNKGEDSPW